MKNGAKTDRRDGLELAVRILVGLILAATIVVISVGFAPPAVLDELSELEQMQSVSGPTADMALNTAGPRSLECWCQARSAQLGTEQKDGDRLASE